MFDQTSHHYHEVVKDTKMELQELVKFPNHIKKANVNIKSKVVIDIRKNVDNNGSHDFAIRSIVLFSWETVQVINET